MTINAGPNIVKDGLVLHLDAANEKSFRGEPTTNLANQNLYKVTGTVLLYDLGYEDGWHKYGLGGEWTSGTYPYIFRIDSVSMTGGETYSSQVLIKSNVFHKMNNLTGMNYVNQPMDKAGTSFVTQVDYDTYRVGRYNLAYTSTTTQPGYIVMRPLSNGTTFDETTDFVWIKEVQVENKTYNTPFVEGTRGNTVETGGGWKDLTGNVNGTLVNNPSYSSEVSGAIVLNGVDSYISVEDASVLNPAENSFSIDCWVLQRDTGYNGIVDARGAGLYGFLIILNYTTAGRISVFLNTDADTAQNTYFSSTFSWSDVDTWMHIAVVCDRTSETITFFKNGIQSGTSTAITSPGSTDPGSTYRYFIGADLGGPEANISISNYRHYDKAISSSEVRQNFEALRGRYGI